MHFLGLAGMPRRVADFLPCVPGRGGRRNNGLGRIRRASSGKFRSSYAGAVSHPRGAGAVERIRDKNRSRVRKGPDIGRLSIFSPSNRARQPTRGHPVVAFDDQGNAPLCAGRFWARPGGRRDGLH